MALSPVGKLTGVECCSTGETGQDRVALKLLLLAAFLLQMGPANPLATLLSAAMMLRFSFNQEAAAQRIEAAVQTVLAQGLRTPDIHGEGTTKVGTAQMGDAVVQALD